MPHSDNNMPCPCGTNLVYRDCCEIYHLRTIAAPTPEKLMRSRYSAYVLLLESYVLNTWHASTRPVELDLIHEHQTHPRKWLGLTVLNSEQTSTEHGTVEFKAKYKIGGKAHTLHEISDFVLEQNHWFYVDGQFPTPSSSQSKDKKRK